MMKNRRAMIAIILLTAGLTAFYYVHEFFPRPIRAMTALFATPTAVASGISYYLNLGIPVYETPIAVIFANLIAAVIMVLVVQTIHRRRNKKS